MAAWLLGLQAELLCFGDCHAAALDLLEAARAWTPEPLTLAELAKTEAGAHAFLHEREPHGGHERACHAALERAWTHLEVPRDRGAAPRQRGMRPDALGAVAGLCHLHLGQLDRAETDLTRALAARPNADGYRATALADLAAVHAARGEPARAADLSIEALELAATLHARWPAVPEVRELHERVRAAVLV